MTVKEVIELRLTQDYNPQQALTGITENFKAGNITYDEAVQLFGKVKLSTHTDEDGNTTDIYATDIKPLRQAQIQARLAELDIKTFKFIDGQLSAEAYEPYRLEKIALRLEYNTLEEA